MFPRHFGIPEAVGYSKTLVSEGRNLLRNIGILEALCYTETLLTGGSVTPKHC
jgi:hypothetical protein